MLFESNNRIARQLVTVLFAQSWKQLTSLRNILKDCSEQTNETNKNYNPKEQQYSALFDCRSVHINISLSDNNPNKERTMQLYIFPPPYETFLDRTFTALVLHHERSLLQKQTMTAWMATLGGGYFFIKQLSKSLQLARQQRYLALQLGNDSMARTCLLNEAYNLIYAGHFRNAKTVLTMLEHQVTNANNNKVIPILEEEEIQRTLRQCHAARILLRRLKKLKHRLKGYHAKETHTVDDFQRVRIVEEGL
jgi:hypothetical protein